MCVCLVDIYMCAQVPICVQVLIEARGMGSPWTCTFSQLWTVLWVVRTELWSYRRAVSAQNLWAVFPALHWGIFTDSIWGCRLNITIHCHTHRHKSGYCWELWTLGGNQAQFQWTHCIGGDAGGSVCLAEESRKPLSCSMDLKMPLILHFINKKRILEKDYVNFVDFENGFKSICRAYLYPVVFSGSPPAIRPLGGESPH